jgi:hypothetical protein
MQETPPGWVRDGSGSGGTAAPEQRWAWTYRWGTPLLVASIVSVVLSGSGLLVAVNTLGVGSGPADPTRGPTPLTGPECVIGTWRTVELEEDLTTGILTAEDPATVEYSEDGTATIDYGALTRFTFQDTIFGGNSAPTPAEIKGTVSYEFQVDEARISYTYPPTTEADINIPGFPGGGLELPYNPSVKEFAYECTGDTMTHQADAVGYRAVLERVDP